MDVSSYAYPPSTQEGRFTSPTPEKEHVFATALCSAFDLSSLAWYSDITHEVEEVTSGHRLELTYKIIQMSGSEKSAEFFIKQQAQLKEKIASWPGDLNKLVHFLEHKYSQKSLSSCNLKGRDRAVYEVLSTVCSAAGIYVLFGNVTKKECDQDSDSEYYRDDGEGMGIYLDYLCTAEGKKIASGVKMSEQHILVADPYTNRSADSESEGEDQTEEDGTPGTLKYHNSVSFSGHVLVTLLCRLFIGQLLRNFSIGCCSRPKEQDTRAIGLWCRYMGHVGTFRQ